MIKKIIILMLTGSVLFANVYADTIQKGNTSIIEISGEADKAGRFITAEVYPKDKSANDLLAAEREGYTKILIYHDQTVSGTDGGYRFEFDMKNAASGEYYSLITTDDGNSSKEDFLYIDYDEFIKNKNEINNLSDSVSDSSIQMVKSILDSKYVLFGIKKEVIDKIDTKMLAEIMLNTVKKNKLSDSVDEVTETVGEMIFVQMLNQSLIENIYTQDDLKTKLSVSEIKDFYNEKFITDEFKTLFTKKLSNNGYKSVYDYVNDLAAEFIFSIIRYPNGNKNAMDVLKAFSSKIGIASAEITLDKVTGIIGNDYSSLSDVKRDLQKEKIASGTGTSGGSSGGSRPSVPNNTISGTEVSQPKPIDKIEFGDMSGYEWADEAVTYLAANKIINGDGNGNFMPDMNITREEFCKIAVNTFCADAEKVDIDFLDVRNGEWYAEFVKKAYGKGLMKGVSDNEFGVGANITREDICVIVFRALNLEPVKNSEFVFGDDDQISDYAKDAVYALKNYNIINGISDDEFGAKLFATRAEAAKIIYGALNER